MSGTYKYVRKARKVRKQLLIDFLGGKCAKCGYSKCIEAIDFHHINPKEKDFCIASKWYNLELAINETRKCVILCSNCHREFHADLWQLDEIYIPKPNDIIIEKYLQSKKAEYQKQCPICKTDFIAKTPNKVYCSNKCYISNKSIARRRKAKRPDFLTLKYQIEHNGYVGTGKIYNVTDNAIRKWLKGYEEFDENQRIKKLTKKEKEQLNDR